MRLYIYLNKDIIKCIAARLKDVSFNIDFFEYSEKKGYVTKDNFLIRPEIENWSKNNVERFECFGSNKLDAAKEKENICNFEVQRRYINIEDISSIKNNSFYYDILERIPFDTRIKEIKGKITELTNTSFNIENNKFLIDKDIYNSLVELYENACDIVIVGYKINCLNADYDVFKLITIYIE